MGEFPQRIQLDNNVSKEVVAVDGSPSPTTEDILYCTPCSYRPDDTPPGLTAQECGVLVSGKCSAAILALTRKE